MCEISFDLEWTIIMHQFRNMGMGGKMHLNSISALKYQMEDAFPMVHFHASQVSYTLVVKLSNVLNIKKVDK